MEISTSHRVSIGSSENSSPHFRSLQLQQIVFQRNGLGPDLRCGGPAKRRYVAGEGHLGGLSRPSPRVQPVASRVATVRSFCHLCGSVLATVKRSPLPVEADSSFWARQGGQTFLSKTCRLASTLPKWLSLFPGGIDPSRAMGMPAF